MNKLIPILIISIIMVSACLDTASQNRIRPVAGDSFFGQLHLDARMDRICVFNTSIMIIFLALIGFSIYAQAEEFFIMQIVGTIFLIAAIQLFCQNEVVTFIVIAILVLKDYILGK